MEQYSFKTDHWQFGNIFTQIMGTVAARDFMGESLKKEILHKGHPGEISSFDALRLQACIGRLCTKYEAAGKIRVFAIGDYWTQWLFKPLHEKIFDILRRMSTDATFDQDGALDSFVRMNYGSKFWSFDLKSATDNIPKELYFPLLSSLIGPEAAKAWNTIMNRPFKVPKEMEDLAEHGLAAVRYTRGQPMGFLSSWGCLALLHHAIVQFSYFRIKQNFIPDSSYYRVLGDDIVISNKELADSYVYVCEQFGIPLSLYKSYAGATILNFASQVISNRGENFSPVSLKEIMQARSFDRKAEFAYRLQVLGYIPKGINNLLRVFFVPRSWKQESRLLIKGTFSSFGRKAYRVLLQPNGYNGLTLSSVILSYMPNLSLGAVPVGIKPLDLHTLSGYVNLKALSPSDRLISYSLYYVDKYLTDKITEFRLKCLKLAKSPIGINRVPGLKRAYTFSDMIQPRLGVDHVPSAYYFAKDFCQSLREMAVRIPLETAELGYDESGNFDVGRYMNEFFSLVSKLPVIYDPYDYKEVTNQVKRFRKEERLVTFGQYSLYERVLRRRLISELVVPLSKTMPVPVLSSLKSKVRSKRSSPNKTIRSNRPERANNS
jgi:hypothetical protein